MAGNNPVFRRVNQQMKAEQYAGFGNAPQQGAPQAYPPAYQDSSPGRLQDMYNRPSAGPLDTGRVTFDDVIMKTLGLFAVLVVSGGVAWGLTSGSPKLTLPIWMGGMFGGLVLGLVIAFMKRVSVPLIVLYAAVEGAFLGAFSQYVDSIPKYSGVVSTAVLATVCTFAGMFFGYKTKLIRVTAKSRRIFGFAILGYLLFSLVQVVALFAGWTQGWGFGGSGMLGIGISILGVGLASYSLAVDFDSIDQAVRIGAPQKYSWLLAHGLIVSVVWLYIEIVRLLARLRD
jgi:uncharacterized YccA/Bax inhibitor family protein